MSKQPPREGARWGDDPAPNTPPKPKKPEVPEEYTRLCSQYGEANIKKALAVQARIQHEFPHLPIAQTEPLKTAREAIGFAQSQMALAAKDGRPHSLPETLDIMAENMGAFFAQYPDYSFANPKDLRIKYGDEENGRAEAKRDNSKCTLPQ